MLDPHCHYNVIRSDRTSGKFGGGGVCALIPKHLKLTQHDFSKSDNILLSLCSDFDIACFNLTYKLHTNIRFTLVYRPPNSSLKIDVQRNQTAALSKLLSSLLTIDCINVLLGDFNLPDINWDTFEAKADGIHDVLLFCFSSLGLTQFVDKPTRFCRSGRGNILDIILSDDHLFVDVIENHAPLSTSDHSMIEFAMYFPTYECTQTSTGPVTDNTSILVQTYDWPSADYVAINNCISQIDWYQIFGFNFDPDSLWNGFKSLIWPILELYVPKKMVFHRSKYKPRYYPKFIRKLLVRKAALWRKLKTKHCPELKTKYTQVSRECKTAILEFDKDREAKLLEANNLGTFYRFVNKKLSSKSGIAPLKDINGSLIIADEERANLLNEYFHSVFTKDNNIQPVFPSRFSAHPSVGSNTSTSCFDRGTDPPFLKDVNISPASVNLILLKLKINSSPGPDQLPPILFNKTAVSISYPLSLLFRSLVDLHELPSEWKKSIVAPIFKKGSPSDPSNYRPISLTCTCCKILETLIASDLLNFLNTHKLISKNQHGFLKKHSTVTNLMETLNDWNISITNNKSIVVAYVDFQKAFDVISHTKLINKLVSYGISGNLLYWIKAFLTDRIQCVRINYTLSSWLPVISGVPQGSVLGPLLFNLFVNDLCDHFASNVTSKLFADDLKIYTEFSFPFSNGNFQQHLNLIFEWSRAWQLPISYSKCSIMELGRTSTNSIFDFSSNKINPVSKCIDLGILVEPDLKFRGHINQIVNKTNQRAALIFRSFLSHNLPNLTRAFKTYIRPLAEYASSVWSPSQITQIMALESIQKKFTKRLPGLKFLSYPERLAKLNLQTLEHRRLISDIVLCYNVIYGNTALNFEDFFKYSPNKSTRGHSLRLMKPLLKSNTQKSSFAFRVTAPWNALSEKIVTANNAKLFKTLLLKFDLSRFLIFKYVNT